MEILAAANTRIDQRDQRGVGSQKPQQGMVANMLSDWFKYLGVGSAHNAESTHRFYFTQLFVSY
ncbi:MAG: hypothetical protein WAP20_04730 [Limnochordia bacterium]|jgi:uncharacterized protein YkwD|nr:hypothetical protein [Bacillota bacterium]HOB08555.1 hypothetical protein [Limnochordia bacterium]HPT92704.1 hypothetical protein [Limnochordia bacterium]HXK97501.1 hypothetical protein [Limnochordia bacterium]